MWRWFTGRLATEEKREPGKSELVSDVITSSNEANQAPVCKFRSRYTAKSRSVQGSMPFVLSDV